MEVGLVAYGHRTKGDCADIEVLVPVGAPDKAAIMAAANKITPLGKTPLSDATVLAAETLKFSEEKATVILISDGEETCDKVPCEVGKELESRGVEFTAHVIGFDVSDPAHVAQLRCLAENTGGKFFKAQDAGELQQALTTVAKEVAEEAPAPAPAAEKLKLSAVYKEGGEAVTKDIRWDILLPEKTAVEGKEESIFTTYNAVAQPELEKQGNYIVRAKLGVTQVDVPWNTETGPKHLVVNLNSGIVKARALPAPEADPVESDVRWDALTDGAGDEKSLETAYNKDFELVMPKGNYKIRGGWGNATAETKVAVEAGETKSVDVVMNAGVLKATALYAAEGEAVEADVTWEVQSAKEDINGNRKRIETVYQKETNMVLPAGKYLLVAKLQAASVENPIEISANERLTTSVVLDAGVLNLKRRSSASGAMNIYEPAKGVNGERKRVETIYDNPGKLTIGAGKYVVENKVGETSEEKEVEVKAGERAEVEFGE